MNKWILIGGATMLAGSALWLKLFSQEVDYNRDVKPILNKNCMGCHGGVKKAGDVSFLFEHELFEKGKSGRIPVVRGKAADSEMIRRITHHDPDERMPKDGPPLSDDDIAVLKKWINQGAKWGEHWAYRRVERPAVPALRSLGNLYGLLNPDEQQWAKNEIDHFILEKLNEKKLPFAAEADKATLIRRVSLDLTGLPPTKQEVADFIEDSSPDAYEKVVDRLLQAPAYGERWASMWMDLARYADTKGYEKDGGRTIWRFRDYVVKAFNEDKPFDQFTLEQLAGDLFPGEEGLPAEELLIATAFHRNTMNNDEGGTSDEEFRVAAQIDRVNTTWEVWQGTTFGCVQCHSHPYDPITQEEYYRYMAFFNNTRDEDVPSEAPTLRFYSGEDSLQMSRVKEWVKTHDASRTGEIVQFMRVMEPKIQSQHFDSFDNATFLSDAVGLKHNGSARLPEVALTGKPGLLLSLNNRAEKATLTIRLDARDGEPIAHYPLPVNGRRDTIIIVPVTAKSGKRDLYFCLDSPKNPDVWVAIRWLAFQEGLPGNELPGYEQVVADYTGILTKRVEEIPVLWEGKNEFARQTHVFERGNWLVKGNEVTPGVPGLFPPMPPEAPKNRLGLARWMISRENPLTARVIVNRFWEQLFGTGIVETLEDFGSQGNEPTHPELLDWLAVSLMEDYQWSTKALLKKIVMAAAYRQNSRTDSLTREKDPWNTWISRGPRVRLSAEQVRDQALAVSGLLSPKMYGPSVMPPQPDGIWLSPYSGALWIESEGEDRYRRAVYTYWKRTAPYPSMMTFDAPSREFCQSRRIRTNTPLQALVTLNDPVYLEAAERLAIAMQQQGKTLQEQLRAGYRMLTFQPIGEKSLAVLEKMYYEALRTYQAKPLEADSILTASGGKFREAPWLAAKPDVPMQAAPMQAAPEPAAPEPATPELAALTVTANVMLNLDNVVTKE